MSWNQNLLMLRLFREKVVMGCFFLVGFGFVKGFFWISGVLCSRENQVYSVEEKI